MPCGCETNLKAAFVLGIIDLVLSCVYFALRNYILGGIGIVVSIVLIVGAKAPNATALLVWMILACLQCATMIGLTGYGLVVAITYNALVPELIVAVLFTVGNIMFQIWTIVVANKARKEIDQGIKI